MANAEAPLETATASTTAIMPTELPLTTTRADAPARVKALQTADDPFASPVTTPTSTATPAAMAGRLDSSSYAARRRELEPKVWGGKANVEEIEIAARYLFAHGR